MIKHKRFMRARRYKQRGNYYEAGVINRARDTEAIKKEFIREAKAFWKSKLIDKIDITVVLRDKHKNVMSVGYNTRPKAIGENLYQVPKEITLYVTKEALVMPDPEFNDLIKHEVIHLGYTDHDAEFIRIASEHKVPISVDNKEGIVKVQIKDNGKYQTVREYDGKYYALARKYAKELVEAGKKVRVRI